MMIAIIEFKNIILIFFEKRVIEENIFCNQRFPGPRFLSRFIQQNKFINNNSNITCENKIWYWREKHPSSFECACNKCFGKCNRVEFQQFFLCVVGTVLNSAYRSREFEAYFEVFKDFCK